MSKYKRILNCDVCGEEVTARWNPAIERFEITCKCGVSTTEKIYLDAWELIEEASR